MRVNISKILKIFPLYLSFKTYDACADVIFSKHGDTSAFFIVVYVNNICSWTAQ